MGCQQDYERVTVMHEAEELSTSSASEHGQETKMTKVKVPGVNIPEFAESIISVEVLAGSKAIKSWRQVIKSWQRRPSNQVLVSMGL